MTRYLTSAIAAVAILGASVPATGQATADTGREAAPVESQVGLGGAGLLLGIVAAAVLIVFVLVGSDDEDEPVSP